MSDTTMPPDATETTAANDTDAEIVIPAMSAIPSGWARFELHRTVARAQRSLDTLAEELQALVALADGLARALDE